MARIDIAVVYTDGRKEVVNAGRPADLIAFADTFDKTGPSEPHAIKELAWLAHRALRIEQPLEEWVDTLDELTGNDERIAEIQAELDAQDPGGAAGEAAQLRPAPDRPATSRGIESHG